MTTPDILPQLDPSEEQALAEVMSRLPRQDSNLNSTGSIWNAANVDLEGPSLLPYADAAFDPFYALNAPAPALNAGDFDFDSDMDYAALGGDWNALFAGAPGLGGGGGIHDLDSMIGMNNADPGLINNSNGGDGTSTSHPPASVFHNADSQDQDQNQNPMDLFGVSMNGFDVAYAGTGAGDISNWNWDTIFPSQASNVNANIGDTLHQPQRSTASETFQPLPTMAPLPLRPSVSDSYPALLAASAPNQVTAQVHPPTSGTSQKLNQSQNAGDNGKKRTPSPTGWTDEDIDWIVHTMRLQPNRASKACEECRRKRCKCGGGYPCDTCKRRKVECVYVGGIPQKRSFPSRLTSPFGSTSSGSGSGSGSGRSTPASGPGKSVSPPMGQPVSYFVPRETGGSQLKVPQERKYGMATNRFSPYHYVSRPSSTSTSASSSVSPPPLPPATTPPSHPISRSITPSSASSAAALETDTFPFPSLVLEIPGAEQMDAETLQYFTNMLQETARKSQLKQSPGQRGSPKAVRMVPDSDAATADATESIIQQQLVNEDEDSAFPQSQTYHDIDTVVIPDVSIPGTEEMDAILDEVLASANWPTPTVGGC